MLRSSRLYYMPTSIGTVSNQASFIDSAPMKVQTPGQRLVSTTADDKMRTAWRMCYRLQQQELADQSSADRCQKSAVCASLRATHSAREPCSCLLGQFTGTCKTGRNEIDHSGLFWRQSRDLVQFDTDRLTAAVSLSLTIAA